MAEKLNSQEIIYVCDADFKEGEMRGVKKDEQWLLIVLYKGNYFALDASCAHTGYPLFKGKLGPDGIITCALHYAQFDCRTGSVVSKPAICENQKTFKLTFKENKIYWVKE